MTALAFLAAAFVGFSTFAFIGEVMDSFGIRARAELHGGIWAIVGFAMFLWSIGISFVAGRFVFRLLT
jgi:hypothetical protein